MRNSVLCSLHVLRPLDSNMRMPTRAYDGEDQNVQDREHMR